MEAFQSGTYSADCCEADLDLCEFLLTVRERASRPATVQEESKEGPETGFKACDAAALG